MQVTSIIRNRGQLTIPDSIRKAVGWADAMSAVTIVVNSRDEIVLKPHSRTVGKVDILSNVKAARAIKGKTGMSTVDFLELDRNSH